MNMQQIINKLAALRNQIADIPVQDLTPIGDAIDQISADVTAKFPPQ